MLFAAYADVGVGVAFLLLLGLSLFGLFALGARLGLNWKPLRGAVLYSAIIGLIQPWLFYLWMRLSDWNLKRADLESLCILSFGLVIGAITAVVGASWRSKTC